MGVVEVKGKGQGISSSRSSKLDLFRGVSHLSTSKISLFKPGVSPNLSVRGQSYRAWRGR